MRQREREDPFAEVRAQLDTANRQVQQIAADPTVQRYGTLAAALVGAVAYGAVIYDWCTSESGKALTAISLGKEPRGTGSAKLTTAVTVTEPKA